MSAWFRRAAVAAAASFALCGPASAAPDRPVTTPTRDAVLGYHLRPATGEPIDVRVQVRGGGKGMRVDLPDTSYVVALPASQSVTLVVPLERTVATLGWAEGPQGLFTLDDRARFTRRAEMTVAGQRCVQWEVVLGSDTRTVCVTADGLVLRNQSLDPMGRRNLVEAFVVRYEPVPEAEFRIPAEFETLVPEGRPKP